MEEIQAVIGDTVTIKKRLKPVYCYKDSGSKTGKPVVRREGGKEKMILQISSGQGPAECELAVMKLYDALKREYPMDMQEPVSAEP